MMLREHFDTIYTCYYKFDASWGGANLLGEISGMRIVSFVQCDFEPAYFVFSLKFFFLCTVVQLTTRNVWGTQFYQCGEGPMR